MHGLTLSQVSPFVKGSEKITSTTGLKKVLLITEYKALLGGVDQNCIYSLHVFLSSSV